MNQPPLTSVEQALHTWILVGIVALFMAGLIRWGFRQEAEQRRREREEGQ